MTNSKHIPKRRFKEFVSDGEWEKRKLGDLSNITAGGDVDKAKLMPVGNFPVLANAHTGDGIIGYYDNEYQIEAPAVTVTGRGEIGFAKARRENFTPVVRLLSVKSNHNVDFLAEAINQNKVIFESTGVPQLTIPKLSNYNLFFPSKIQEENTIGDFMLTIDNIIAINQHKLDKLKNLKKSYLAELFPAEGERIPKRRFPGFEGEWEQDLLGNIVDFSIKTNSFSRENLTHKSYEVQNIHYGDILVKFQSVLDLKQDNLPSIIDSSVSDFRQSLLQDGDVIFADAAEDSTVGKAIEIRNIMSNNVVSGLHTIAARPRQLFAPYYLGYYLNSDTYHNQILPLMQGTKVSSISKSNLQVTEISFPKIDEQKQIGNFFKKLDQSISLQQQKLDKLNDLKKAYLNELFV